MNANEIRNEVLMGSHSKVKAFLAPLIAEFGGSYNGCGGIVVECSTRPSAWEKARAAFAKLDPVAWRVSKPRAVFFQNDPFHQIKCYAFDIKVREG